MSDEITRILDHAGRSVVLLPAAHTRTNWTALMRGLLGVRGAWADDAAIYAIRSEMCSPATLPSFLCPDGQLETVFGNAGALTIRTGATVLRATGSDELGDVALYLYEDTVVTADADNEDTWDMLRAHDLREIPEDLTDEQIVLWTATELAGAPSAAQEIEGEGHKLATMRRLATAFGDVLDLEGAILGLTRDGATDADYRAVLYLKAAVNASTGTIEEFLTAAAALDGVDDVQLIEAFPATVVLYLHGTAATAALRRLLLEMPGEAIDLALVSCGSARPLVFGPEAGWWKIGMVSGVTVTVIGDATAAFAAGDTVRAWDFLGDAELLSATVVSAVPSGANTLVTLTKSTAALDPTATPQILENVSAGVADPGGYGMSDAWSISAVSTSLRRFTVAGEVASDIPAAAKIQVLGSTGNDGTYTVESSTDAVNNTLIVVTAAVPDATADGQIIILVGGTATPHGEALDEWAS